MTATSKITRKYQTTIPKAVVQALGVKPSDRLVYEIKDGTVIVRARTGRLADLAGKFAHFGKRPRRPHTLEEMDEAIGAGAASEGSSDSAAPEAMIALDTNVLIRFITEDDPVQARAALRLLSTPQETFFVSDIVLVETVWTLRRLHHFSRAETTAVLQSLLDRKDTVFEDRSAAQGAVQALAQDGEFSDALIVARARTQGCSHLASFDENLHIRHSHFVIQPR